MTENNDTNNGAAKVQRTNPMADQLASAHADMPPQFVNFVTDLWKRQYTNGCRTFTRELIIDRKVSFDRLLSTAALVTLVTRAYETDSGCKALQAMVKEAVCIPECWHSLDKRMWGDKETYLRHFESLLRDLEEFLNIETVGAPWTTDPDGNVVQLWTEFKSRAMTRTARSTLGKSKLLRELSRREEKPEAGPGDRARAFNVAAKPPPEKGPDWWRSQPMRGNLLADLRSSIISTGRWDSFDHRGALIETSNNRHVLSVYDLQKIIRAFLAPLKTYLDRLRGEHDPGLMRGNGVLRFTAQRLNKALDPFTAEFAANPKVIKFSRYGAISCFIDALYGEHYTRKVAFEPRRIHAWCRTRAG
jgi:hypothetical protein